MDMKNKNHTITPLPKGEGVGGEGDIFNTKWVIIGVIVAALLIPLLSGCGVKGDLKHPKATAENR